MRLLAAFGNEPEALHEESYPGFKPLESGRLPAIGTSCPPYLSADPVL